MASTIVTEDGVVDYPITAGMALTGVWQYQPNVNGPNITAIQDGLKISRGPVNASNQWTYLSLDHQLQAKGGVSVGCTLKIDTINPSTEVKFTMTANVILRYDGSSMNYCWWDGSGFPSIGASSIRPGDSKSHAIMLCISPSAISVFEDGDLIGIWNTNLPATFQPLFHWQILGSNVTLDATLSDIIILPPLFVPNVRTPWDVAFSNIGVTSNQWSIKLNDAMPVSFFPEGFMRVSTDSLSTWNSWLESSSNFSLPPSGVIMYRIRVNKSGGSETKITIFGGYILRLTNGGQNIEWDVYLSDLAFHKQGDSTIKVGSQEWTVVMIHYSSKTVTLFENGIQMFSRPWWTNSPTTSAIYDVQHLDTGTAVSVDISHVRTGSVCKSPLNLIQDLQPSLANYYPLKEDVSDLVLGNGSADLIPTQSYTPVYQPGRFGNAMVFSGGTGAVRIPPYPYGRFFPSYTMSLFTKIISYPSTDNAGLVGQLCIRPDGKLAFTLVYVGSQSYAQPSATYVSNHQVPLNTWTSIIVTYTYEESRLSFYIGGVLDAVFYTSNDNSSQYALTPLSGFVGATLKPTQTGTDTLVVLNGQISDIVMLRTHIHASIAEAMASVVSQTNVHQLTRSTPFHDSLDPEIHKHFVFFLVIPLAVVLVASVAGNIYLYNSIDEESPSRPPSLEQIVKNIRRVVGVPAPNVNPHKCTREEAGIPPNFPVMLDIGGEGPLVSAYSAGFSAAINVNDKETQSNPDISRQPFQYWPIPNLIRIASWNPDPTYPFADNFAERIVMQSVPLTSKNVTEVARIITSTGIIDLWVDDSFNDNIDRLARLVNSHVQHITGTDQFQGNYGQYYDMQGDINPNSAGWLKHKRIESHKGAKDEL